MNADIGVAGVCRNVSNRRLCHMHGTLTSTCDTPAIYTVCAYQTLRAVFIFAVFFYTISMCVHVCIYVCEFVPVCL